MVKHFSFNDLKLIQLAKKFQKVSSINKTKGSSWANVISRLYQEFQTKWPSLSRINESWIELCFFILLGSIIQDESVELWRLTITSPKGQKGHIVCTYDINDAHDWRQQGYHVVSELLNSSEDYYPFDDILDEIIVLDDKNQIVVIPPKGENLFFFWDLVIDKICLEVTTF